MESSDLNDRRLNENDVFKVVGSLGNAEVDVLQRFQTTSDPQVACLFHIPM